jgi:glycerol-3-phosphate dehydrogenase (NAD(P)+)
VFTGHEQAALDRLAATFRTGWYHVWTSTDLVGVEVSAALKNCYALGVGFAEGVLDRLGDCDGRDRNHNYEAALFAQAVGEIAQMVELLGGRPETPFGLAGVGDLFVTSTGGRNIRVGRLLGSGLRMSEARARMGDITLEGAAAIQAIDGALPKLTDRGVIGAGELPAAPAARRGRPGAAAGGAVERLLRRRGRRGRRRPRDRGVTAVTRDRDQGHVRCPGGVQPHAPGV